MLFAGLIAIGFGEWINHPRKFIIVPSTYTQQGYKLESTQRENTFLGWLFNLIGLLLIGLGLARVL